MSTKYATLLYFFAAINAKYPHTPIHAFIYHLPFTIYQLPFINHQPSASTIEYRASSNTRTYFLDRPGVLWYTPLANVKSDFRQC